MTVSVTATNQAVLALAAFIGGFLNAVAGGGSFVTFPSLIFAGITPVIANADEFGRDVARRGSERGRLSAGARVDRGGLVLDLHRVSLVGGSVGAFLLLRTSKATRFRWPCRICCSSRRSCSRSGLGAMNVWLRVARGSFG